ncbi:hypothetical protein QNO08_12795 [Arthrobacter sp. zg-Y820]|uniref:hypothetical protein n=1 Tax=unclassified Arthrobacter TaxID=235627 RepID=UPI001E5860D8|nr:MULTISPECIES: hypothetical protein [unclassified Arthrobacter]MCC9196014.1 hypothetical protein [Arthrobacter sp. zg-Y820]MDK1278873.1 hypothetical protein [Arthrobacter sp. zg.Y820]WIB08712.1 hypothetical protein QNO08_12795 [Arthrobacter sp. zg-Y820]
MDAVGIAEDKVRELIRVRGLDPASQIAEARRLAEDTVTDYDERSLLGQLPPLGAMEHAPWRAYAAAAGFGSLQPLLDAPAVEENWINSPTEIYAARASRLEHLVELGLLTPQTASFLSRFLDGRAAAIGRGAPLADVTRAQR